MAPLAAGVVTLLLAGSPGRIQGLTVLGLAILGGGWLIQDVTGLNGLFAVLLLAGGVVIAIASLYRSDSRLGFYPLLAILLLSLPALPRASTHLEFFFIWELITLSSYFLILRSRDAQLHALPFLLFSLVAASFLLAGFAVLHAESGSIRIVRAADGRPIQCRDICAFHRWAVDQGRSDRRPRLVAGSIRGSRRRRICSAFRGRKQSRDIRTSGREPTLPYVPRRA